MSTVFYKMMMAPDSDGLNIITNRFISIRETTCVHFCLTEFEHSLLHCYPGETFWQAAKRCHGKIYRINKSGSRIAFPTEQQAFNHLVFLKQRHLKHMRRDIKLVQAFLDGVEAKTLDDLKPNSHGYRTVPDTVSLVSQHFAFY